MYTKDFFGHLTVPTFGSSGPHAHMPFAPFCPRKNESPKVLYITIQPSLTKKKAPYYFKVTVGIGVNPLAQGPQSAFSLRVFRSNIFAME